MICSGSIRPAFTSSHSPRDDSPARSEFSAVCAPRSNDGASAAWLQLPRPEAINRIRLSPLSVHELHAAVASRLRRSFSRPAMGRIHEVSGGNPFLRNRVGQGAGRPVPPNDGGVVAPHADRCRPEPTRWSRPRCSRGAARGGVHGDADRRAGIEGDDQRQTISWSYLLEIAEGKGIIAIDGNRIQFAHPLLARGVYTEAAPARRRSMHRRLAEIVDEPELRARHLALAATSGDDVTLRALDKAAESARARGAPAAAAELMDLAIGLGGDAPERRLRSALHHFDAGDHERAAEVLRETVDGLTTGGSAGRSVVPLGRRSPVHRRLLRGDERAAAGPRRRGRGQSAARADTDHVGVFAHARQPDSRRQGHRATSGQRCRATRSATFAQPRIGHAGHVGFHGRRRFRRHESASRTGAGGSSRPSHRWFSGPPCSTRYCWS